MQLAAEDLFHARWTDRIHDEWITQLLENRPDLDRPRLERRRKLMDENAHDCLVTGYEDLIEGLGLPDPDDRHVLAAAIGAKAQLIVTYNQSDFPVAVLGPLGIEALHPDTFVVQLLDQAPARVCKAVRRQRLNLRNPPKSVEQFLDILARQALPQSVALLSQYGELI
jgi:hypothetical protein